MTSSQVAAAASAAGQNGHIPEMPTTPPPKIKSPTTTSSTQQPASSLASAPTIGNSVPNTTAATTDRTTTPSTLPATSAHAGASTSEPSNVGLNTMTSAALTTSAAPEQQAQPESSTAPTVEPQTQHQNGINNSSSNLTTTIAPTTATTDAAAAAGSSININNQDGDTEMPDAFVTPQKPTAAQQGQDLTPANQVAQQVTQPQQANHDLNQPAPVATPSNRNTFDMGGVPHTPMSALDSNAYMAMALAQMAGDKRLQPHQRQQGPSTVTPAQVTLPDWLDEVNENLPMGDANMPPVDQELQSFARIEFADSVFQMTTYAVIIGRDHRAMVQARRDERRAEEHRKRVEQNERMGLPPPSPMRHDRGKFSKSYVSEEGGMLGPESDSGESGRPKKKRKTTSNGSSHEQEIEESEENLISNRQYISHTPGAAAVDLESLRPSPDHVPIIGIHSPGPDIASKTKAISREHVRIQFNKARSVFEAIPLHKNGFFVGEVLHNQEAVVLRSGDQLQIKDVDFRFVINGVPTGKTGAEEEAEEEDRLKKKPKIGGGKEMSFDFEGSHGNGQLHDTSSSELSVLASDDESPEFDLEPPKAAPEVSSTPAITLPTMTNAPAATAPPAATTTTETATVPPALPAVSAAHVDPTAAAVPALALPTNVEAFSDPQAQAAALEMAVKAEHGMEGLPEGLMPSIPKKRGPGRPPKNGIMSKREQRLLKKQAQEMAKKTLPQPPPTEPPIKRKVGRPRKHPLPEDGDRPEKRKYKPRKPREDGGEGSDAERRAKEKKDKKVRPKSPPLELVREHYTEEQLQKPSKNYGVLIDETLTTAHNEGRPEGLTLKQIYKRITLKYPWFYFHTETKGWESSVRHNLIGNEAFKKDETTGLWSRVPGVELDAGKKRKATSPDRSVLAGYGAYGHHMYSQYGAQPHLAGAQGYQHQSPYQAYTAQQGQQNRVPPYSSPGAVTNPGQPGQPAQQAPPQQVAPVQLPGYGAVQNPQASTYNSPYAARPQNATNPPVKTEDGAATTATAAAPPAIQPPAAAGPPVSTPQAAPASSSTPGPSTAGRATQTPPVQKPQRPVIDPRLLRSVVGLKNGLIENLKKARSPKAEAIVMSALNRCLGLKTAATVNPAMEDICMRGIQKVLDGFNGQSKSPTPSAGASAAGGDSKTPGAAANNVFDPNVLNALVGFKNITSNALKANFGEDRAETMALSAIDRVLGLADASIVPPKPGPDGSSPPPADASKPPSHEGLEQKLIGSVKQLLSGLNQKLPGT